MFPVKAGNILTFSLILKRPDAFFASGRFFLLIIVKLRVLNESIIPVFKSDLN